jgi:hypothetical protein
MEQAMTMRTMKSSVTFVRPFRLGLFGEQLPVETDEERPAYQRTALDPQRPRVTEIAMVDPRQFEEALTMDGVQPPVSNVDPPKVWP